MAQKRSGTFQLQYPAVCLICNEIMDEGDWAIYDEEHNLVHLSCYEKQERDT